MTGPCYSYLLRCRDGSLYSGWTKDLQRRLAAHNGGRGGKYTRSHRPVELVASWSWRSRRAAMQAEGLVKALSRAQKEALVTGELTLRCHDDRVIVVPCPESPGPKASDLQEP